jgi:tripartite-type tricarboxylate transporter receptor subunit TctC
MKKILLILMTVSILFTSCSKETNDSSVDTSTTTNTEVQSDLGDYPNKPVTFLVPAGAGAMIDVLTRNVTDLIELGKPSIILNKAGAAQIVGTSAYVAMPADGYTILTSAPGGMFIQPYLIQTPYNIYDFRHLAILVPPDPLSIVVSADSPYDSWDQIEDDLKSGKELSWSTTNPNGNGFLGFNSLMLQRDYEAPKFVPFTGSSEGIAALLGHHIDMYVLDTTQALQKVKDGQFKLLMEISDEPSREGLKCGADYGFTDLSAFVGIQWLCINKDAPDAVVNYLKKQIDSVLVSDEYKKTLALQGYSPVPVYTEEEITKKVLYTYETFGKIIDQIGMGKN